MSTPVESHIPMRMMKNLLLFLLSAALSVTIVPGTVISQEFTVYTEPLAPVHFEENGQAVGIATEIVEELFRIAGYQPQIKMYPWKRSYYLVQKEKNQFIYTLNRTPKRETLFRWIGPILNKRTYLYKRRGRDDIKLTSIEDAQNFITAVILGHSLTTELEELGFEEGKHIIKAPNKSIQTKVFVNGRSDLITGNEYTIYRALKSVNLSMDDVEPALFISESGYYLGAHPDTDTRIVDTLQKASETLRESHFADKVIKKYMSQ